MRRLFLPVFLFLLMMGCRISDTTANGGTGAELTVSNQSTYTVFFTLDDASTAPLPEYTLQGLEETTFFWDLDSNLFSQGNGEVVLTYYFAGESPVTVYLQIEPGEIKYYAIGTQQYHLIVENDTSADAWFWLDGQNFTLLHADESTGFSFSDLTGPQPITISYRGDHIFSDDEILTIAPGIVEDFILEADAGALSIYNNSADIDIIEVYLAPSDSLYWGSNQLAVPMEQLESCLWTLSQNFWDILLVDENSTELVLYEQMIVTDQTLELQYSDFALAKQHRHPEGKNIYNVETKSPQAGIKKTEEL
ncbi:MAG: hypothetical protein J7K89_01865 [Candidatus Cloacimonetes bacterium]|nr:hypothetical protein [Candidatus Cloacimonadota bacterium]